MLRAPILTWWLNSLTQLPAKSITVTRRFLQVYLGGTKHEDHSTPLSCTGLASQFFHSVGWLLLWTVCFEVQRTFSLIPFTYLSWLLLPVLDGVTCEKSLPTSNLWRFSPKFSSMSSIVSEIHLSTQCLRWILRMVYDKGPILLFHMHVDIQFFQHHWLSFPPLSILGNFDRGQLISALHSLLAHSISAEKSAESFVWASLLMIIHLSLTAIEILFVCGLQSMYLKRVFLAFISFRIFWIYWVYMPISCPRFGKFPVIISLYKFFASSSIFLLEFQ